MNTKHHNYIKRGYIGERITSPKPGLVLCYFNLPNGGDCNYAHTLDFIVSVNPTGTRLLLAEMYPVDFILELSQQHGFFDNPAFFVDYKPHQFDQYNGLITSNPFE